MLAVRRHGWSLLGVLLVVAGVVLAVTAQAGPGDVSWLAYSPVAESADWEMAWTEPASRAVVLTWWQLVGGGLAVLGLLVLVARAAYTRGRRRADGAADDPVEG